MDKIINLTFGIFFGILFSIGLFLVIIAAIIVILPITFYVIIKETLRFLTNK